MKKTVILSLALLLSFLAWLLKSWYQDFDPEKLRFQDRVIIKIGKITDLLYFPYLLQDHQLPTYQVFISTPKFNQLKQSLPSPFIKDLLQDYQQLSVAGRMVHQDQVYNLDLKVRGDMANHWSFYKKSYQLNLKNNQTIDGIEKLNFILPSDRRLLFESFSLNLAEKFNLMTPRHWFGWLKINDQDQGIYFIQEDYEAPMLANHQKPLGDIFSEVDDPNNLDSRGDPFPGCKPLWEKISCWRKIYQSPSSNPEDFSRLDQLLNLLNQPDDAVFTDQIPALIDLPNFFNWQAHAALLGSFHQDIQHNQLLYLNPQTNKFEFIPKELVPNLDQPLTDSHNPLVDRILSIDKFRQARNQVLINYLTDQNLTQDLQVYQQLVKQNKRSFYQDHHKLLSNWGFDQTTKDHLNIYQQRFSNLQQYFQAKPQTKIIALGHLYPQFNLLDKFIEQINQFSPDKVIFLGDFIPTQTQNFSLTKLWQQLHQSLNQLNASPILVPGNHDYWFYQFNQPLSRSFTLNQDLYLILDTNHVNYPDKFSLSQSTIDFVKTALKTPHQRVFIFMHHAIWLKQPQAGINVFYPAENWSKLANLLANHQVYVFSGDGSQFLHQTIDQVNYYITGLPNHLYKQSAQFIIIDIYPNTIDVYPVEFNLSSLDKFKSYL